MKLPSLFVTLAVLSMVASSPHTAAAKPAHSLTIGMGAVNPVGFHDAHPAFSWKLPAGVKRQTAYRLAVESDAGEWDSGWVESAQTTFVPYAGPELKSRQRGTWRVTFRDERGKESGWSKRATFELGLLTAKDWEASWIRPAQDGDPKKEAVAHVAKTFVAEPTVKSARLYVTARGLFQLSLNGTRVGRDHFAHGWTAPARLDTVTYDVTDQIKRGGENRIEAALGSGWYAGHLMFKEKYGMYGTQPELLLQLELTRADGATEVVVSDASWQGTWDGPIVSSSIYDGENYDARRVLGNWTPVKANADLGKQRLTPKTFAPVRETQVLVPQKITTPAPGRVVFDLGQNMVGWARLKIPVTKDQTVTIRFAEMLNADGTLYTANYRDAKSVDTYTPAKDGTISWEPTFTFHGFRYVELSGLPAGAKPAKSWIEGVVLHSDLTRIGTFTSSLPKLNRLQENITWGQRGNFVDIPTDCPQRDERLGWTGDAQAFCPTAMFNYDSLGFWSSWLVSMRDEQLADGRVPSTIPAVHVGHASPGWMDAATFIPWDVYVRSGDRRVLEDNFAMMEKLVGFYRSQTKDGLLPGIKGYGDWLQPYAARTEGDTPLPVLGLAFYGRSARIVADAATALGRTEVAQRADAEAAAVAARFAREYFDAEGKIKNVPETQTTYVLALAFELLPADLRPKAFAQFVRMVETAEFHLRTGFLGTPYIVDVLDKGGRPDLAYRLLTQETYPSWFYSINQGATTMWERWNSYSHDKGFGDAGMNSFNHYAYGAIGQWMYERVAGLTPDPAQPGYRHFFVRPLIDGPLQSARAELETPYGKAVSGWKKQGNQATLEVVVPPNTTATVEFTDGRAPVQLEAGNHQFKQTVAAKAAPSS